MATAVYFEDGATLYPTFDLTDVPLGPYDVVVVDTSGSVARLSDGFSVVPPVALPLAIDWVAPDALGLLDRFTFTTNYNNPSNNDQVSPLVLFSGDPPDLLDMDLPDQTAYEGGAHKLRVEALDGPAGILRPGATGSSGFSPRAMPCPRSLQTGSRVRWISS